MSFLHPWAIVIGALAAAAPLLVHLLTRPRPVRMPLSTLRFVREAIQQRRARHRLRDLIVLVLRTAAVMLLALAVARPQWGQQAAVSDRAAGDAVRVVVLDVSQSMAATAGAVEQIERARTVAARYLRYRPGLWANLVLAGAVPRPVFEGPSTNFEALREELARCHPLPQRMDVKAALELAGRMLAPASPEDRRRRELVMVSDFQRSSWTRADFSSLSAETKIQLESTATAEPLPNLAVLRAEGRAESSQARTVQIEVDVGNFTPTERKVVVDVSLGQATRRLSGTCPKNGQITLSDEIELRTLGWQSGYARLVGVDDALAADNQRPLVVELRPKPVYLLVTREPARRRLSSSHFLQYALAPDEKLKHEAAAAVTRLDPDSLDARTAARADLILLDHPGRLGEESVKLLAGLLRRGKPILYVTGELIDATNLKRLGDAAGGGLQMPVQFSPPPAGQVRRNLFLASLRRDEPPFAVFGDSLTAVTGPLRFAGGLNSRPLPNGLADDVLASYNDGSACIVLTASDAGVLAVVNADLVASNFAKSSAFVPILDELIERMLSRKRATNAAVCGEPLVQQLPEEAGTAAGLRIVGPDGTDKDATDGRCGQIVEEGAGLAWHWPAPQAPGVYQVRRGSDTVFALAVGIPAEESQLESIDPQMLKDRLAVGRNVYFHGVSGQGEPRDDFWKWFGVACVFCMLGEITTLLAFRT